MGRLAELASDSSEDGRSRTFVFQNEGHTLGNALSNIISRYSDVEFCAYTVTHPSEAKMNFRIQAKTGRAVDILERGLRDLEEVCDHTLATFETAYEDFNKKRNQSTPMEL